MKVHLIAQPAIDAFVKQHARSKTSFAEWLTALKGADWEKPEDIKRTFGSSDLLGKGSDRVVFNIAGNNYRMICRYFFRSTMVHLYICFIGTHAEYDNLCKKGDQYTVWNY